MPTTMPGLSITEAKNLLQQTDRIIRKFPEVEYVFGKAGRAETATDPAPLSMIETTIRLKDPEHWRPGLTMEDLIREMDQAVKFPGLANSWGYPIRIRIDMLSTGIKTPVGFKIMGPDLEVLNRLATDAEAIFKSLPETASAFAERVTGGYYLDFAINRREAARYGLTVGDVQDVIATALGGENITQTVEGLERYPVNLRYFQNYRENLPALRRILIPTMSGSQVPMDQVADIKVHQGPDMIRSENARRSAWLYVDIRGIDVGSYIAKAKKAISARLKLPPGYNYLWSGQFEYMEQARQRLQDHHPHHPGRHLSHSLRKHRLPRQGLHRAPGGALLPGGGHLAALHIGLPPEPGGGGGAHRPGRIGRRNGSGDAPLPGSCLSPPRARGQA